MSKSFQIEWSICSAAQQQTKPNRLVRGLSDVWFLKLGFFDNGGSLPPMLIRVKLSPFLLHLNNLKARNIWT